MIYRTRWILASLGLMVTAVSGCGQSVLVDTGSSSVEFSRFFEREAEDHQIFLASAYWMGTTDVVAEGPSLRRGNVDPRVAALKRRLLAIGDLTMGSFDETDAYDELTEKAVQRFQERYGLSADGVVGPRTRAALNGSSGLAVSGPYAEPHVLMVLDRHDDGIVFEPDDYFVPVAYEAVADLPGILGDQDFGIYPLLTPGEDDGTVQRLGHVVTQNMDGVNFAQNFEVEMARPVPAPFRGLIFAATEEPRYVITRSGRALPDLPRQQQIRLVEPVTASEVEPGAGSLATSPPRDVEAGEFLILGEAADRGTDRDNDDRDRNDRDDDDRGDRDRGDGPDTDPGGSGGGGGFSCSGC